MSSILDVEVAGYRIERVLGRGGMSVVYLAEQVRLGRKVALKVLSPEFSADPGFRERFAREWHLSAALEHPNVVQIYDAGESKGLLYMAMRLVDGSSLSSLLRTQGKLDPPRALAIVRQIAEALDAAHAKGLIHGDVKPGNILISKEADENGVNQCFLVDFGIARRAASGLGLTEFGRLMGTVDYMPPEVIEEGTIEARTDVYSLGCVLYECLAGSPPFPRTSDVAVAYAHLEDPPPLVTDRRPELPREMDSVIATALAKQTGDRYSSCVDLTRAVEAALGEAPALPRIQIGRQPKPRRRWRAVRLAAVAGLIAAGAAAGILVFVSRNGQQSAGKGIQARIFVMNADGTAQHPFLGGTGFDRGGISFSPSGDRFAFVSSRDGNFEIYEVNLDGTGLTNVTNDQASDSQPAWSPDGDRIAFVSDREDGNNEIYVMNPDGSDVVRLTTNPGADEDPTWSPDGERIAFVSDRSGNEEIHVMSANGEGTINLTNKPNLDISPSWSPSGDRIAFVSRRDGNHEIYVMNADGGGLRRLTFDTRADQGPVWSPHGTAIAFVSGRSGTLDIYLTNLTGSSLTRLTTDPGDEFSPAFSPDGKSILFIVTEHRAAPSPTSSQD